MNKFLTYCILLCGIFCFFYDSQKVYANTDNYIKPFSYVQCSDLQYKKNILKSANNSKYKLRNMKSVIGPKEIEKFIKSNNNNKIIYTPSDKDFSANLHNHTISSDGQMCAEELLDRANEVAQKTNKTFYIAVTDHNTTDGAKKVLDVLQQNPKKYKNIKVVLGMEVYSEFMNPKVSKNGVSIHILAWGINPYDEMLNKVFYKENPEDKWNYSWRAFESAVSLMSNKGLTGIAHPARYVKKDNLNVSYEDYYRELFNTYKLYNNGSVYFTEGFYRSYDNDSEFILVDIINDIADDMGIIKTGSTDSHGHSIMHK